MDTRKHLIPCTSQDQAAIISWRLGRILAEAQSLGYRESYPCAFEIIDMAPYYNGGSEFGSDILQDRDVKSPCWHQTLVRFDGLWGTSITLKCAHCRREFVITLWEYMRMSRDEHQLLQSNPREWLRRYR